MGKRMEQRTEKKELEEKERKKGEEKDMIKRADTATAGISVKCQAQAEPNGELWPIQGGLEKCVLLPGKKKTASHLDHLFLFFFSFYYTSTRE